MTRGRLCLALLVPGVALWGGVAHAQEVWDLGIIQTNTNPSGVLKQYKPQRQAGLAVFSTPAKKADGLGDGPFDGNLDTRGFGHRPTLQGNGLSLRVNGLDAQSCNECHTIVKNGTQPPTLGLGGVGGLVQNAMIMPTMIDVADSQDDRVAYAPGHNPDLPLLFDGVADYSGRFANPPFLFGGGGVEMLAKEMTVDLQALLAQARTAPAGTVTSLDTHGVHFGSITSLGGGNVDVDPEGIGPADPYQSTMSEPEFLVVRPFGRKGDAFSMRDFDRGAMQFHFGRQPVEVVGANTDPDGDGVVNEVTVEQMTNLHIFDVTNPRSYPEGFNAQAVAGFHTFDSIGCTYCHKPYIKTRSRMLPLAYPEVATNPNANVYKYIDLKAVGFPPVPSANGVYVQLFSDLKRHDMGPRLQETLEFKTPADEATAPPQSHFITARLWGIADTAPYLHDGRATTLFDAIEFHGGEAQAKRDAFMALPAQDQQNLLYFLSKLRTPNLPNEDLLPLP